MNWQATIYLSDDFRSTCMGFEPEVTYTEAMTFTVEARNAEEACEVAYAVTNSYPGELHCSIDYEGVVETYRSGGHRSLSVGDVVSIDRAAAYAVANCGFTALECSAPRVAA